MGESIPDPMTSLPVQGIERVASAEFNRPILDLLDSTRDARGKFLNQCVPLYKLALKGNWTAAKSILDRDKKLLRTAIGKGWPTILHVAAGANHVHFVVELLELMDDKDLNLQDHNGNTAFFLAAGTGNVKLAEIMLQRNPYLAKIRGVKKVTPLHFSALQGRSEMTWHLYPLTVEIFDEEDWSLLFFTCVSTGIFDLALEMLQNRRALALERDENDETALHVLARKPLDFNDLIWEADKRSRSIIHIAVLHRHASIFNLTHDIGAIKDILVTYVDKKNENNLLHLAAKLAPPKQLEAVSGAACQMSLELLWFEEVKKIMLPSDIDKKNSKGLTPRELFTMQHADLRRNAESWMKGTAKSCMLISTVIATGVFAAAIGIPGGDNDKDGTPNYLKKSAFLIFALSDAVALISSSTSILIFLSILISRYAEYDFHKSLPFKLISGLVMLFISITTMMIAFSCAFFITYYHGSKWVPGFISVLALCPILLLVLSQFPLWADIIYSTYYRKSLFRPSKHMLQ
ncbi:hypothetical protein L6164_017496 [Bauhinia variegata]|uniref:Uncharacterized protein n=1 Tax=Bauhinia variegata TaxID=167791 RepID=A0ACB9N8P0_BAUVA|nr:hypothetical protein L6164_017496 [Bauhinia variegata]